MSRSRSPIQARNASPLRSVDLSSHSPKFSTPSDSPKKKINLKHFILEKENEQDPAAAKPVKGRSPVMTSTPQGPPFQKNFMAPTLSASFKAVGPSCQRKRVLGKRNETVNSLHTSVLTKEISEPAVRFQLASTQVEENTNCSSSVSSPQIKETTTLFALSPTIRVSPSTGPATTTQPGQLQSADLPPYDPKVNYLSPRPQFLHYKPKPRGNLFGNELDFLGTSPGSTSPEDSTSSERSDDAISVQTEEEYNLSKETNVTEVELQPNQVTAIGAKFKIRHVLLVLLIGCICLPLLASYSNPNRLLEVSNKINVWLSEYLYMVAREDYFPRERNIFPLANLTFMLGDKRSLNEAAGKYPSFSWEYKMGIVSEEKAQASFHMVHSKNKVSEEQIQYEIGKLEEEEIEAGSTSEQQEMAASSILSETKEDTTQPDMFENSEPEKPKISESELAENQEVEVLETIESETLKPRLIEPESGNIFVGDLINILKKTAQGMAAVAVLLSLATAVAASAFAKREQNQVPVSNSIHGDKSPGLVHGSSESHVPNRISLQQKSTLDIKDSNSSSFKVGAEVGICFSTPCERQARRESESSSGSYGSYMSFEKISSKKGNREGEEMTPVRRSTRLRTRTISS